MIPRTSSEYMQWFADNCSLCEHWDPDGIGDCVIDAALTACQLGVTITEDVKALLDTSSTGCPRLRIKEEVTHDNQTRT